MGDWKTISISVLTSLVWLTSASAQDASDRFYQSIRAGDSQAIAKLLAAGTDVNTRDSRGDTPLMYAAAVGSAATMKQLIAAGADVNAKDNFDATALLWCTNSLEKVRLLVEKGANVNARSKQGRAPLPVASAHDGNVEVVRLLVKHGADTKSPETGASASLIESAGANDSATMKLLLEQGADVKAKSPGDFTALLFAAGWGNVEIVKLLLAKGADVNAQSAPSFGRGVKNGPIAIGSLTPLMVAATSGSLETVRLLLDAGSNLNATDVRGMTSLMLAVATDHPDDRIVRLLLDKGAKTDPKSKAGETALDWAMKFQHPVILPLIQKASAGIVPAKREPPATPRANLDVRAAVERSVGLVQKSNVSFLREGGCISCHAQNISSVAVASVRNKGIRVDEPAATGIARDARLQFTAFAGFLLERVDPPAVEILTHSLFGLSAERVQPDRVTDSVAVNIASQQHADGTWGFSLGIQRPPTADSYFNSTAYAIRALRDYFPPARKAERDERIAKAAKWLMKAEPSTTDDQVTQLLGAKWAGITGAPIDRMTKRLVALQRSDGGWAGTPYLQSDAFSTATALHALAESGGMSGADAAYQKGVKYLLSTQAQDGSWYVASRAPKFQPYFDGGFPYGHDEWISQWATGYAVAALSHALPETRAAK